MKSFRQSFTLCGLLFIFGSLLGACYSSSAPQAAAPLTPSATVSSFASYDAPTLLIHHPWDPSPTGENGALVALEKVYSRQHGNIKIDDSNKTCGVGVGLDECLVAALKSEQPPDIVTLHAGKESVDFILRGEIEPITKAFKQQELERVMPPLLLEQLSIKGEIYDLPIDIHRSNVLWYNPKMFAANHLAPPRTFEEFFAVADTLKSKGITPLAIGGQNGFEVAELFECVLLATYGPNDYVRLVQGDSTLWADGRLNAAIVTLKKMLQYTNTDSSTEWWGGAAQRVVDGKAGMTVMGDWVDAFYKANGAKPVTDYGWVAAPGTDGRFLWLSDSFALPKGAPHRDAALAWLQTAGTREGQDAFNPLKGSIPARTDPDKKLYDEYLQWSIDEFRADQLAPSIVHGAAAPQSFISEYNRALIDFSQDQNEQALADALRAAATQLSQ